MLIPQLFLEVREFLKKYHPLPPENRRMGDYTHSKTIINPRCPYAWEDEFPLTMMSTPEELEGVKKKRGKLFRSARKGK